MAYSVRIPSFPSLTDYSNFTLPPGMVRRAKVEPWGMLRVLEDGSLEVTLKSTELDHSGRIKFHVGADQPVKGEHLRRSFNDECSIFGIIVPRAKRKHEIRVTCS